jgi:hypothetical protein
MALIQAVLSVSKMDDVLAEGLGDYLVGASADLQADRKV